MKIRIGAREVIISQPLSSIFVYSLGLLTVGVSFYFFLIMGDENSRFWWAVSLLFWGIGAILAGTSYQAFGYEIKCAGRQFCSWTSWWEIVYLVLQQLSINAMLVAIAYSCTSGSLQSVMFWYALVSSLVYVALVCIGALVPVKSLITFEFMVLVSAPVFLLFCFINGWRYYLYRDFLDLSLLGTWIILFITIMAYWYYSRQGITKKLWSKGIWFSENDVLHVLLIFWMIYIATVVAGRVKDYSVAISP